MTHDISLEGLSRLIVEHECTALVLAAANLTDSGQYEALAALFSDHAVLVRPNGDELEGRESIISAYAGRAPERISRHLILNTQFTSVTSDIATSVSQVLLWAGNRNDEPGPFGRPIRGPQIVGKFEDTFAHTNAGWKIERRHASFDLFSSES